MKTVDCLQYRGGIAYEINTEEPFTGKLLKKHKNGLKEVKGNYENGKEYGLTTYWYENGQKRLEINYKNGKEHGLETKWDENGQKESKVIFKDGKKHGITIGWYENGQKKFEVNYKNDKHVSNINWDENGEIAGVLMPVIE